MRGMTKSDWLIAVRATTDDVAALLGKLDRSEGRPCRECGTKKAENWDEERAARELEGAVTRLNKAAGFIESSRG